MDELAVTADVVKALGDELCSIRTAGGSVRTSSVAAVVKCMTDVVLVVVVGETGREDDNNAESTVVVIPLDSANDSIFRFAIVVDIFANVLFLSFSLSKVR